MNSFGRCVNYNSLEEFKAATVEAVEEKKNACSDGVLPSLPMGLAFDFDEITQTR